jgi:hypothetical protein
MEAMSVTLGARIGGALLGIVACGALMAEEPEFVLGGDLNGSQTAPEARRVTLGSNLFVEPCSSCNYDPDAPGYFVIGPDNCFVPGTTQWVAVPFIAAATGAPKQISAPIIPFDPRHCPTREVTLSIYTDACYPTGPGTPLVSGVLRLPRATCDMGVARLTNAPTLTRGQKYWVVATTNPDQSGLDAHWYGSNNAQCAINTGTGWTQTNPGTPAFLLQAIRTLQDESEAEPSTHAQGFGGNLFVDPCTGCNYDPNNSGRDVRGPENCTSPGNLHWTAVPFVAAKSGVPTRISASIILHSPTCTENTVTLSLYTDDCDLRPGEPLVSGIATVPLNADQCQLAVARLTGAPALQKGVKYWVVATTDENQAALDARWYASNNAQFGVNLGYGWIQFGFGTPGFLVQ